MKKGEKKYTGIKGEKNILECEKWINEAKKQKAK